MGANGSHVCALESLALNANIKTIVAEGLSVGESETQQVWLAISVSVWALIMLENASPPRPLP